MTWTKKDKEECNICKAFTDTIVDDVLNGEFCGTCGHEKQRIK